MSNVETSTYHISFPSLMWCTIHHSFSWLCDSNFQAFSISYWIWFILSYCTYIYFVKFLFFFPLNIDTTYYILSFFLLFFFTMTNTTKNNSFYFSFAYNNNSTKVVVGLILIGVINLNEYLIWNFLNWIG